MIILMVDDHYLEAELEEDEWPRLLGMLGLSFDGVCKVCVNVVREGIDSEELYARFTRHQRERDSQVDIFDGSAPTTESA